MHCRQWVCIPHMVEFGFVSPIVHKYNFFQSSRKVLRYCQLKLDKSIRTSLSECCAKPEDRGSLEASPRR